MDSGTLAAMSVPWRLEDMKSSLTMDELTAAPTEYANC